MGTSTGRLRDPVAERLGDQMMDILGKSLGRRSYMFFKFNSETYLTYFDRLLETCRIVVAKNLTPGPVVKLLF